MGLNDNNTNKNKKTRQQIHAYEAALPGIMKPRNQNRHKV